MSTAVPDEPTPSAMASSATSESRTEKPALVIPDDSASAKKSGPSGMNRVARSLASRTTDLLGIAIVLIGGLTMGRQVIEWWRTDPTQTAAPLDNSQTPPLTWGDTGVPVSLEFGDHPCAIVRRTVRGTHAEALAALRASCRELLDRPDPPHKPLDDTERRMLDQLGNIHADEEQPGVWQMYQIADAFGVVIGTRDFSQRPEVRSQKSEVRGQRSDHPPSTVHRPPTDRRVVCWGLLFPMGKTEWALYTFHSTSKSTAAAGLPTPPLPPESRRVLSLQDERGGAVVSLTGGGLPTDWARFYDSWFAGQKWRRDADWQQVGAVRQARFRPLDSESAATADLQIVQEPNGRLSGLLTITSAGASTVKTE